MFEQVRIKPVATRSVQYKFGTEKFFKQYLKNQIEKEGKTLEVVHRVHFSMSSLIFETHKGKEAYAMLLNLTRACEEISGHRK